MGGSFPSWRCISRIRSRRAARKQERLAKKQAKKEAAEKRHQEKVDMRGYCVRMRVVRALTIRSHLGRDDNPVDCDHHHSLGFGVSLRASSHP